MTIVQPIQIQVAQKVFEAWDKIGVTGRAEKLQKALNAFPNNERKMAAWQIENAEKEIAETRVMHGPTGERNELSSQGRGPFLCMSLVESDNAKVGLVGQVFTALIAGNPVITVGPTGQEIMDMIAPFVAEGVIQNIAESAQDSLIEANHLAGIATLCDPMQAQLLNQRLAAKGGLICQLIEETDSDNLSAIAKPHYLLRFVTERTVSNNTTAIGGNATLLELGSMND
ncbi:1-pyrroline-5-carboxylate dehydrogenase [Marinomonas profundimaris]|uniref:1-pyrroline-5-carboxylate dehydrogenase n=1 Tax=Marinomonas profundimaris TaxID=1208321 RepID=W1RRC1_9GAMM|nr:1-pyrroline-5-carboxylate dehydrogenase [Marinomonas profundimaris]ETI59731.1 1-pyrroline-5-carboxylate dehydrogenase [Marinomonas profundimaris]